MPKVAFIAVDPQIDFCPGGALPVNEGNKVVPVINQIAKEVNRLGGINVLTQDFHPVGHLSFASSHISKKPYDSITGIEGIGPVLWPDHCVIGSKGAEFHPDLDTRFYNAIIRKGTNPNIDSYSGFFENDQMSGTGLAGYLEYLGIKRVIIAGLAFDFCVKYTALDAVKLNFDTTIIKNASKSVFPDKNSEIISDLTQSDVKISESFNITIKNYFDI